MVRTSNKITIVSLIFTLVALCLMASATAADFTLKLHHALDAKSLAQTRMLEPWAKDIEQATDGRVKVQIYSDMSLGGDPPQLVRQVQDGTVDIVWVVNGYTPDLFTRTEVFELPFVHINNPHATNLAMRDMFDTYLASEYGAMKVMFLHVHQGQAIQMVDREVRSPADLKKLRLRVPSRTGLWVVEALGAVPIQMPVSDLRNVLRLSNADAMLTKKIVDGALIPWEIIPTLGLQDLTSYQIEGHDKTRFGNTTFQLSMNKARWDALPPDIQAAIEKVNAQWYEKVGFVWASSDDEGIAVAVEAGNNHITLTPAETDAFRVALEPVVQRWLAEAESQNIDGNDLLLRARELIENYSKIRVGSQP